MSIANNLRQLRLNSGMTQEQVAEKIGVTRQALSSYESGRTRPDVDMLLQLSEVYDTDLDGVVYGQDRALKSLRITKQLALFLFVALASLTLVSSILLWSANHFFPMGQSLLSADGKLLLDSRIRLLNAWEAVDGIILTTTGIGFLSLLVLLFAWRCKIPLKSKVAYIATLSAVILVIAFLLGIADPLFSPTNYLFTPIFAVARIIVLFLVHLVIDFLHNRHKEKSAP